MGSSLLNLEQLPHLKWITIQYNLPTSVIIPGGKQAVRTRWYLIKGRVWSVDHQSEDAFGAV